MRHLIKRIPGQAQKCSTLGYESHTGVVHGFATGDRALRGSCFGVFPNALDQRGQVVAEALSCCCDAHGAFQDDHETCTLGLFELRPDRCDPDLVKRHRRSSGLQLTEEGLVVAIGAFQRFEKGEVGSLPTFTTPALVLDQQVVHLHSKLRSFSAPFCASCNKGGESSSHDGTQQTHN
ncbi:hypothetical protein ACFV3N_24500 [Streptomyces bauhiniae]|uniref:hypothetical protein n=1 Tax=Streptomyces bauhiniae TaxID=2340725 RepID=UPI00364C8987